MIKKQQHYNIGNIYQNIVQISRSKYLYLDMNLEDSFETRFDLTIFLSFMIFYFYKKKNIKDSKISQQLFDYMFNDFENNLREMGFGDIAVNKKMKLFIKAFYGRIAKYNEGMHNYENNRDKSLLQETILNNIYKNKKIDNFFVNYFVDYMINNIDTFLLNSEDVNIKENFKFKEIIMKD